jgi:hypothetical protein
VFAIPVGLFLDRVQRRRAARKDAQQAASILSKALSTNAERLTALADTLNRQADIVEELLGLELDAETWQTVRPLVGDHLPVDLATRLARHFSETWWIDRAVEVLIKAVAGPRLCFGAVAPAAPSAFPGHEPALSAAPCAHSGH